MAIRCGSHADAKFLLGNAGVTISVAGQPIMLHKKKNNAH